MAQADQNLRKRVLVIDDDESVLSFLTFSLQGEGFSVLEARSAEAGLAVIEKQRPDLILLDIMLPGMSGLAMCEKLRELPDFANVPILLITAYADKNSLGQAVEAGAQGLIEKPIMFSELLVQILDALAGRFSLPTRLKYAV